MNPRVGDRPVTEVLFINQRSLWMRMSILGSTLAALALLAAGCANGEADAPLAMGALDVADSVPPAAASPSAQVGIVTDAGTFWFAPSRCMVGPDNDVVSYMISGAGSAPDGQPVFVEVAGDDGSQTDGPDLRINVGVDRAFKPGDPQWIANDGMAHALGVAPATGQIDGQVVTLAGVVFSTDSSTRLTVEAPIRIDCSGG
jgi:hypothetical protein